ncbi:MAG TPA: MarR family transcriptional regulator [Solirubrobacteraceae bacterium]|nr:MarR family transcriptional regulator [Solirubrobacteraceae bacterium]
MLRSHACLVKRLDIELEAVSGLPLTSLEVLRHLRSAPDGRMRMCDLACSVMLSRSGLTRLVDRLERDGLLCRKSCDHDARGAYAALTDAGRERLDAAHETYIGAVREHFLSRFTSAEMRLLGEFWTRVAPANAPCGEPADCA